MKKVYAVICRNFLAGEYLMAESQKRWGNKIRKVIKRPPYQMYMVLSNGDEIHLVPEDRFKKWSIGRSYEIL